MLWLYGNETEELPAGVAGLKRLKFLNLIDNPMESLPEEIRRRSRSGPRVREK